MTERTSQQYFYPVLISVEEERCCYDCRFWRGRCTEEKKNHIARSRACEEFEPKDIVICVAPEILEVKA